LDRLKILLTGGVIVAHAAMSYGAAGTWIYSEDALAAPTRTILSVLVGGGVLFALGLFFLIAGILTSAPLHRRGPGRFLRSRLWRLGTPVLVYAVVVWPLLQWWTDRVRGPAPPSLVAFYRQQFAAPRWTQRGTGPMWFVAILLLVTAGWCLWRHLVPGPGTGHSPARSAAPGPTTGALLAVATVTVTTFLVRTRFEIDSAQFLDLHVWLWPQSATLFVLGAVGAERGWFSPLPVRLRQLCRAGVAGAAALMTVLVLTAPGPDPFRGGVHWQAAGLAACEGLVSVSLSLLILDGTARHVLAARPHEPALARAAYGAYVAQGPVLVALAVALRPFPVPGDLKFLALAALGVLGSFGVGALVGAVRAGRRPTHGRPARHPPGEDQPIGERWARRMLLPDGSRNPQSIP
jgi:hypothetical protein